MAKQQSVGFKDAEEVNYATNFLTQVCLLSFNFILLQTLNFSVLGRADLGGVGGAGGVLSELSVKQCPELP
jgi:hypothetical protein